MQAITARWVSLLIGTLFCFLVAGCSASKPTAAEQANQKRWDDWQKQNVPDPKLVQGAFETRQRQLAEKRAKEAGGTKTKSPDSPDHPAQPDAVKPAGKAN